MSQTHPVGRFKARVFASLGFTENNTDSFIGEIRRIAAEGEVSDAEDTEFGRKYTVAGDLKGPAGTARVLTVWIQEAERWDVRLVTVNPRWP